MREEPNGESLSVEPGLAGLVSDFLAQKSVPGTRRVYRRALHEFLDQVDGLGALRRMDHRSVTEWRNALVARGNARPTVNRKLAAVRGFFDFLISLEMLKHNPAAPELVESFKVSDESRTPGLSRREARDLVAACDDGTLAGLRDKAIVLIGVLQGLRRSEIAGLRVDDIQKGPVDGIDGTGTEVEFLRLRNTKTSDFARVALDPRAAAAVGEYVDLLARPLRPKDPLFFSLANGAARRAALRPLNPYSVNRIIQERAKRAGLKRISAHSLRHTCATLALDGGAKIERVQAHLRHRDPKTTIRYYRNLKALRNDAARHIRF